MSKLLKIGIVGCGAIGSSLAEAIVSDFSHKAQLVSLYDIDAQKSYQLSGKFNEQKLVALSLDEAINRADLIIEATKVEFAFEIAQKTISASCDIMIMSVGGIIERYRELEVLSEEKNARIFIPSGALCGIDGLKAAACGKIKRITLTTRKPPKAFLGSPYILKKKINLNNLNKETVIFEGDALSAIKAFPQNINVAATLNLASVGVNDIIVRIVASPDSDKNIHEIEIDSDSGKIFTRTENVVHPDNPKTSYLAVLSAKATLKQILTPIKVGT